MNIYNYSIKNNHNRHNRDMTTIEIEKEFKEVVKKGDVEKVKNMLKDVDPSMDDNYAICCASRYGYLSIVNLLLEDPRVDPSSQNNFCIVWASSNGHLSIVERLLEDPRVDPSNNHSIIYSSINGHLSIVERLLQDPRVNPEIENRWAIRTASLKKRDDIVKMLSR